MNFWWFPMFEVLHWSVAWIWLLVELEPKKPAADSCGSCEQWYIQMVIGAIPPLLSLLRIFRDSSSASMSKAIPASQPSNFEQLCKISLLVALSQFPRIHPAADRHTRYSRGRPRLERFFDHAYCPSTVPGLKNRGEEFVKMPISRHLGIRVIDICWIYLWSVHAFFLTLEHPGILSALCEIWVLIVTIVTITKACTLLLGASKGGGRASRRLCSYLPQQAGFQNYQAQR